ARGLVETQSPEERRQPRRIGKGLERPAPGRVVALGSVDSVALELVPRGLEQLAEGDARGTGRLAAATAEAEVEVASQAGGKPDSPCGSRPNGEDTPARRSHFLPQDAIGRTLRQADAAVDAGSRAVRRWGIRRVECAGRPGACAHKPPTKRPG